MVINLLPIILVLCPFLAAGLFGAFGNKKETVRDYFADLVTAAEFAGMLTMMLKRFNLLEAGESLHCFVHGICGFGLSFEVDGFRMLYGLIATLMWMMTTILSREYFKHHENRNRFYIFMMMTLGATLGVFFSADLYTTFIFFEIMSFTSYAWVAQEETGEALRAAGTYLAVAVIGGMVMLMGLFITYHELGTLNFDGMASSLEVCDNPGVLFAAGICMLVGFGAKAGAFPLHIWLPKAHPVAPAPASALLSGILTKTGIFGILVITTRLFVGNQSWGLLILVLGVLTMFGGAFLAVFSIDLKRTLACSSMSQIGFILVGVAMQCLLGEENALAVHGTFLHMANHSLIKLVLFMAAGVVFMNTHALDLNKVRGFGRKKNLLKVIFLIGALAIAGIPFFSGYVSKTLLHESILEYHQPWIKAVEYIFLFSGGLTLAYMTKLFVAVFVEKNTDKALQAKYDAQTGYMNFESGGALTISAVILLVWGLFPNDLMDRAAVLAQGFMGLREAGHEVHYFTPENLKGALVTLVVGGVVYGGFIRALLVDKKGAYVNRWPKWLDMENLLYRPIMLVILPFIGGVASRIADSVVDGGVVLLRKTIYRDTPLPAERREGNAFTEICGRVANSIQKLRNGKKKGQEPEEKDYVHIFAMKYLELQENERIITRSLSFGLMLFGIGLSLTLIYILFL